MTPPSTMSSRSSCRITDGIQSPWIQPLGRAVLEEDLPRADFFPFPCTAAFFARSRADVLSFTILPAELERTYGARVRAEGAEDFVQGEGKERVHCLGAPSLRLIRGYFRVADW